MNNIINHNVKPVTIGGDHFITYLVLKTYAKKYGKGLSLIHFDAHYDTWNDSKGKVDHGTMFNHAVQEGIIDPKSRRNVSIRNVMFTCSSAKKLVKHLLFSILYAC
ncbi:hypothetical protein A9Q98_15995 [Thalassotalea sp. 42_200_T64]|nr:hypothetical protein A9Q98_15995 [Thalassotalea sp. 42_200_T64]